MPDEATSSSPTTTSPSSFGMSTSGMSGYVSAHKYKASSGSGFYEVDAARELGLDLESRQYNTRLLALTKPADYAAARQAEFDKVVEGVKKVYDRSYAGFSNAGMPHEMAKGYAVAAANTEKQVCRQIMETLYPSGANVIGNAS